MSYWSGMAEWAVSFPTGKKKCPWSIRVVSKSVDWLVFCTDYFSLLINYFLCVDLSWVFTSPGTNLSWLYYTWYGLIIFAAVTKNWVCLMLDGLRTLRFIPKTTIHIVSHFHSSRTQYCLIPICLVYHACHAIGRNEPTYSWYVLDNMVYMCSTSYIRSDHLHSSAAKYPL